MSFLRNASTNNRFSVQSLNNIANFIIFIVLILIIIMVYYFTKWLTNPAVKNYALVKGIHNAKKQLKISSAKAQISSNGVQMTYSMWLYINNWDYNYGTAKHVFHRGDINLNYANPNIWLYPRENKLMIRFQIVKPTSNSGGVFMAATHSNNPNTHPSILNENFVCDLPYVPIQKWMNLIVTLNNNVSDVYLDGKLLRSCALSGVPHIVYNDIGNDIYLGGDSSLNGNSMPGFDGYISNVVFKNDSVTYPEVTKMYSQGPVAPQSTTDVLNDYFKRIFNNIFDTLYKCKNPQQKTSSLDDTITITSGNDSHTYVISDN